MRLLTASSCAVLVAAAAWAGCQTSALPEQAGPAPLFLNSTNVGQLSLDEFNEGARLYRAKCARCHKFYNPADYNDAEWRSWMTKMNRKARLKPEQAQLLSRYLDTFRSAPTR